MAKARHSTDRAAAGATIADWQAAAVVTLVNLLLVVFASQHVAMAWCELPILAFLIVLARVGRVSLSLPLAYAPAVFLHLSEPNVQLSQFMWLFFVAMLWLVQRERNIARLAAWGFWSGFIGAAGIYAWILGALVRFFEISWIPSILTVVVLSLIIATPWGLFLPILRFLHDRLGWPLWILAPGLFAVVDYWSPLPLPLTVSLTLLPFPMLLQAADLIGTKGISLLLAFESAAIFGVWNAWSAGHKRAAWLPAAVGLGILLVHVGYGAWAMRAYSDTTAPGAGIDVAMIQPMSPLKLGNDLESRERISQELARLTRAAIGADSASWPDLVVWPEGAAPFDSRTPAFNREYVQVIRDIQTEARIPFLVHDVELVRLPGETKRRYYSTATLIEPVGDVRAAYRKTIRMPFSEYLPLESRLPWLRRLLPEARSLLKSEVPTVLPGPGGPIAALICYEVLFPEHAQRLVALGSSYIVNLTNDRWYGPGQQPPQHLAFAQLLAIENRQPVIRCTNSGISALIDARGVIDPAARTGVFEQTTLRGKIYPRPGRSLLGPYRYWLLRWILPAFYAGLIVYGFALRRAPHASSADNRTTAKDEKVK